MTDSLRTIYESLARVLLRCWIGGFVLVTIWAAVILGCGDSIHRLHGTTFGVSNHELDLILYSALALFKLGVFLFFLLPWLALRLELRRMRNRPNN